MTGDKNLIAEVLDAHGRCTVIYQDHDGVALDFGLTDRNLTIDQALDLARDIVDACFAAMDWQEVARDDA